MKVENRSGDGGAPIAEDVLDLLIVGAGPAGLLASIIASKIGLSHRVIERRSGLHAEPSAHVLKTHTMEVYRRAGIAEAVFEQATPTDLLRYVTWCESVSGLVFGRLDLAGKKGPGARFAGISPAYAANLPQSLLEPTLYARAKTLSSTGDPVTFGAAFRDFVQDDEGVTVTIEQDGRSQTLRARYLIGADGAGSRVRRTAGIDFEGPAVLAQFIAIHIRSDVRIFLERDPGVLFFIRSPGFDAIFIMHQPVGSQVLMMRYDPEVTPFESFDEATCRAIVDRAFGRAHDFSIVAVDRWAMSAQVATDYRRGRVLLAGDAAHRFPPTGGLGLNTGVEDVENLVWKLAAVLRGQADDILLDSYARECRPIAVRNTRQSVTNHQRIREVTRAIGAEDGEAAFQSAIDALRGAGDHPRFASIQTAINAQVVHFAHLELEMAASFAAGAFVPPDRAIVLPVAAHEGYQPSFTPGHAMPHLWIAPGESSIDALRFDRMTLFAPADETDAWRAAAAALPSDCLPVDVVPLDPGAHTDCASAADYWGPEPYAILVRPDGRIAWVAPGSMPSREQALAHAMTHVLGRPAKQPNRRSAP